MIPLVWQIVAAAALDLAFGDPRWMPHPVKGIGKLAMALEAPLRRMFSAKKAGIFAVALVVGITCGVTWIVLQAALWIHPLVHDLLCIALLYTTLAARDLGKHGMDVFHALHKGDMPEARKRVGYLVGRDTDDLDEGEITRATVESLAENTVDAVTAPLLFAIVGGPVGAMAYKAMNTLDSTFGYKNERYLHFGWASARLDDVANFIPARLSALMVPVAAALLGLHPVQAVRTFLRDRKNHPSPNGGQIESTMAGALNVRLGGWNSYFGEKSFRPYMGDANEPLRACHIQQVNKLMLLTSLLVAVVGFWFCGVLG